MGLENIKSFNVSLEAAIMRNERMASAIQKKVAMDILRGVILKTPVDTGRARGNWQIGICKSPEAGIEGKTVRGKKRKYWKRASSGGAIGDAVNKMKEHRFGISIFVTNNVEYILYLEEGTPKIKAAKMLALTLEEVKPA